MLARSAASISRLVAIAIGVLGACGSAVFAEERIVKPRDGSWQEGTSVEIIARAADGLLLLDGRPIEASEPFPGVLHARAEVAPGQHLLRLESPEGAEQASFHAGGPPDGEAGPPYVDHPPLRIDCAHCHTVSRRGRFRFGGGCQTCHTREAFVQTHSHELHELASCGMCHDAHGASAAKLLVVAREQACKQCHN